MKKKIALLLAAVMAFTVAPVTTIFAGSTNRLNRDVLVLPKETTLTYQPTAYNTGEKTVVGDKELKSSNQTAPLLILDLDDSSAVGQIFRLKLENATWAVGTKQGEYLVSGAGVTASTYTEKNSSNSVGYVVPNGGATNLGTVGYEFVVDANDATTAVVTINEASTGVLQIPMAIYVADEGVSVTVTITDNNSVVTSGTYLIAASSGGKTTNTVKSVKSGSDRITLDTIIFKEGRAGIISPEKSDGSAGNFKINAPTGYRFVGNPNTDWKVYVDGIGIKVPIDPASAANGNVATPYTFYNITDANTDNYYDSYKFTFLTAADAVGPTGSGSSYVKGKAPIAKSTTTQGYIAIDNIQIEPLYDSYVQDGKELSLSISDSNNDCNINTGSLVVAKASTYTISFKTTEDAKSIFSGREAQQVAEIRFEELEKNAWLFERATTFTLPVGVKISKVEFNDRGGRLKNDAINAPLNNKTVDVKDETNDNSNEISSSRFSTGIVTFENGNQFTIRGLTSDGNDKAKFDVKIWVNVEPGFEGPIEITASGTAVPMDLPAVKVAEVKSPITIEAKSTDVEIGYQQYKVSDIKIIETEAGAIQGEGRKLLVKAMDSYGVTDIQFASITPEQWSYTGDIRLALEKNTAGILAFNVTRKSITEKAEITITGIQARIDRTVPWGTYDLVVYGDAVYTNYTVVSNPVNATNDRGELVGMGDYDFGYRFEKYLNVVTEGSNVSKAKAFSLVIGSDTAIVGDKTYDLVGAPYIANDRTMLPLRDFGNLLDGTVYWDGAKSTATVVVGTRTVKFVSGDKNFYLYVNGADVSVAMDVAPEITNERMYLPVRAMEDAFACTIEWDGATQTVSVNPSGVQ